MPAAALAAPERGRRPHAGHPARPQPGASPAATWARPSRARRRRRPGPARARPGSPVAALC